jgi:hypothetical protein
MSIQKFEALSLGKGNLLDQSQSAVITTAPSIVTIWNSSDVYTPNRLIEHAADMWRALVTNVNSTPSINNPDWELVYKGVKDGDINIVIAGTASTLTQRTAGEWLSFRDNVITVTLLDNQITPAVAFTFIGSSRFFTKFEYTIKRDVEGRKRRGEMNILQDGATEINYDHEFNEVGADVNVWLTPVLFGANVQLQYTSGNEGNTITMRYTLNGWS